MEKIETGKCGDVIDAIKDNDFIKTVSANIVECILKYAGEEVYHDGGCFFTKNGSGYEEVAMDDLVDRACESCYEKLNELKEDITLNIDEYDARLITHKMYDYLSVKDEYKTLDGAFRNTKYAAMYEKVADDMIAGINAVRQGNVR